MIYYELSDLYEEHITPFELKIKFMLFDYIKFYAFILHNKTKGVKPHYHCLIQVELNNKKAKNRIEKDFQDLKPYIKNVRNQKSFARYLTHKDYAEKEKYLDCEVITSNINQYNDLINQDIKISKIESIIKLYYDFILERATIGEVITYNDAFKWWLNKGQANYFLTHNRSILELSNIGLFQDEALQRLEEKEKIYDNNNYNSSYTVVDSFFETKNQET